MNDSLVEAGLIAALIVLSCLAARYLFIGLGNQLIKVADHLGHETKHCPCRGHSDLSTVADQATAAADQLVELAERLNDTNSACACQAPIAQPSPLGKNTGEQDEL